MSGRRQQHRERPERRERKGTTGVSHVAVAVHSIERARPFFETVLGLPFLRQEDVPTEGVRVAFFDGGGCLIELLEPLHEDSSVARFLQRRGEGIHHVAFETAGLEEAMQHVEAHLPGALLSREPRPAAGGARAAFLHPKKTFGALIELYESPPGGAGAGGPGPNPGGEDAR